MEDTYEEIMDELEDEIINFIYACEAGDVDFVKECLSNGLDPNIKNPEQGHEENCTFAITAAANEGDIEIIKTLIEYGANINVKTTLGNTPLHLASYCGNKDVVRLLINNGAKINERNNVGETPVFPAIIRGNQETTDILLKNGANMFITNFRDEDPIEVSIKCVDKTMVKNLIEKGVIDLKNIDFYIDCAKEVSQARKNDDIYQFILDEKNTILDNNIISKELSSNQKTIRL